jgi:ABC-type arginine transport system permease subunit
MFQQAAVDEDYWPRMVVAACATFALLATAYNGVTFSGPFASIAHGQAHLLGGAYGLKTTMVLTFVFWTLVPLGPVVGAHWLRSRLRRQGTGERSASVPDHHETA